MQILEYFYQNPPEPENNQLRKLKIHGKYILLKGPKACGKKELILCYCKQLYKKEELLFIDASKLYFKNTCLFDLPDFIKQKKEIKILVLYGLEKADIGYFLENIYQNIKMQDKSLLITSNSKSLTIPGFAEFWLDFYDFEERLANARQSDTKIVFNQYLQSRAAIDLKLYLLANFSSFDLMILKELSIAETFSTHKLYKALKNENKISKDKLYKALARLEDEYIISLLPHIKMKNKKKLFFYEFGLKSELSFKKNFASLFENMLFCELLKLKVQLYFDNDFSLLCPKAGAAFVSAPFKEPNLMLLQAKKLLAKLDEYKIELLYFVSLNQEYELKMINQRVKIIPFDKLSLSF